MGSTAVKFLRGLEWLCERDGPAGVTEMSVALRVSKSNAHRILSTLAQLGYAYNREDGRYEATLKTWEVGSAVIGRLDFKEISRPLMAALSRKTGETVHLSILSGREVIYLEKVESTQPVRAYSRIGGRAPVYAVATGKALLAASRESIDVIVPGRLKAFTPSTITNRAALKKELERIRRDGYAVNKGEWREDVYGIGAAILNDGGELVAAIGISGPGIRFTADRIKAFAQDVVESAASISAELGYRAASVSPSTPAKTLPKAQRAKRSPEKTA